MSPTRLETVQTQVEALQAQVAALHAEVQRLWQTVGPREPPPTPRAYAVVIEQTAHTYNAYIPDLPGCVAVGQTVDEVTQHIREALAFHLEGLQAEGLPIPEPTTRVLSIDAR
jgi:predicted RNase H-like HicB family nuclease